MDVILLNRLTQLPLIVSPDEVLRPEFESVAWTQRALLLEGPSERLTVANLQFGVPSGHEVVRRLFSIHHDVFSLCGVL